MFESFLKFLPQISEGSKHPTQFEHNDYRLAAAALLVHTAAIDGNMSDLERDQLYAVVKRNSVSTRRRPRSRWRRRPRPSTRRSISINSPA
jgi:uncharacterized tellurite resistance protein B-like protein